MFSASVLSVSMSVVLRSAKKLGVNTDFVSSFANADVGTGLADFLAVFKELVAICLLCLFISWKL
jgi:hypothetical protein